MDKELLSQRSCADLAAGLKEFIHVIHSENGNRGADSSAFLEKIEAIAPTVGITRTANISHLSPTVFPTYQSCRPSLYLSPAYGQNSGAQGKGVSHVQAKISCLMETIESYCAEPKVASLIRGSYAYLKNQYLITDPRSYVHQVNTDVDQNEAFMWSEAYSIKHGEKVLIPAETIYFPFVPNYYRTRSAFICGSNGLASGASYLEATIHALYELIERYYVSRMEAGTAVVEALFENEINNERLSSVMFDDDNDCFVQLYSLTLPEIRNLPVIMCCLIAGDTYYVGWGCSATVDISIDRAASEAFQCRATHISGTREDMLHHTLTAESQRTDVLEENDEIFGRCSQPEERTMHIKALKETVANEEFRSLNEEFEFISNWLNRAGFPDIYIANLCRVGIELPVVKAIVPQMDVPLELKQKVKIGINDTSVYSRQFSFA